VVEIWAVSAVVPLGHRRVTVVAIGDHARFGARAMAPPGRVASEYVFEAKIQLAALQSQLYFNEQQWPLYL